MNNTYTLQNFRVLDSKGFTFKISPITILTGCNSSGKSTIIKSLMLVENLLNKIKSDYINGDNSDLEKYELEFNKGKHKLGTFTKAIHKNSKDNEITISWSKASAYVIGNIDVEITFILNNDTDIANGKISAFKILYEGNVIVFHNVLTGEMHTSNLDKIIESFEESLWRLNEYHDFKETIESSVLSNIEEGSLFATEETFYASHIKENPIFGDVFFGIIETINDIKKTIINKDGVEGLLTKEYSVEKFDKSKTLFDMPIFKMVENVSKENTQSFFEEKIKDLSMGVEFHKDLLTIVDDFINSKFDTLFDYFKFYENKFLEEASEECCLGYYERAIKKQNISKLKRDHYSSLPNKFHKKYLEDNINGRSGFLYQDATPFFYEGADFQGQIQSLNFDFSSAKDKQKFNFIQHKFMMFSLDLNDKEFDAQVFKTEGGPIDYRGYYSYPMYNKFLLYLTAIVQESIVSFPSYLENVSFVDANRSNVQRIYAFSNQGSEFNEVLVNYLSQNKMHEENSYIIGTFLNDWVKEFEIADSISLETTSEGLGILIYLLKNGEKYLLADEGYGITQLLALLIQIEIVIAKNQYKYKSPFNLKSEKPFRFKESTIVIEEPETNLHPKFQSKLARMFVEVQKEYNINFLLETHSEYLVRGLQTHVAKGGIDKKDIAIYYMYHPNPDKRNGEKPQIEKILIKDDGRLDKPFGPGFFDEADNLAMDLLTIKSTKL